MGKFTTGKLDVSEWARWDEFVRSHPDSTFFHSLKWLSRFTDQPEVYVARDANDQIRAGIALHQSKKYGVPGYYCPQFTAYNGPLYIKSDKLPQASAIAEDMALVQELLNSLPPAKNYDFILPPQLDALQPYFLNHFTITASYTYVVPGNLEEYRNRLVSTRKRYLKQAMEAVTKGEFEIRNPGDVDGMYALLSETNGERGWGANLPVFQKILELSSNPDELRVITVHEPNGEIASGIVIALSAKCGYLVISSISQKHRNAKSYANQLAQTAAIEFCLASGRTFDFCGSYLPGIERHFRQSGGAPIPVYRVQKSKSRLFHLLRMIKAFRSERIALQVVE